MHGLELFSTGWKGNEAYKTSFDDADLDPGGFNWIVMGTLNTGNNSFALGSHFRLPAYGRKLVASVLTQIGAASSLLFITVTYTSSDVASHSSTCQFVQGSGTRTTKLLPFQLGDVGVLNVLGASTSVLASGSIQLASSVYVYEQFFSTDWDPPSPGL